METAAWENFLKAKERFRRIVTDTDQSLPGLKKIQQKLADNRSETSYIVETPVVYNSALDGITANDTIKLILVADNPGRREQAKENRRYLTGPSGKIANNFFTGNPSLGIDFLKNVIILNKTPIHSPRTIELKTLCSIDEKKSSLITGELEKSQKNMADLLLQFHEALCCPVWITGYSEMKKGGIFEAYTERLKTIYKLKEKLLNSVFIYRHFSMNQFIIDLKKQAHIGENTQASLKRIGKIYRQRILG